MRKTAILFLIFVFSLTISAQKPKSSKTKPVKTAAKKVLDEKQEFEKAVGETSAASRIAALEKFIENFPKSSELTRARELLVSARAQFGEERLQAGDIEQGVELFKLAVEEAPVPMSEKLFADVVLQFPTNLFWRGQRDAAFDVAEIIERKAEGDAKQLLGLATFYLGIESASQAKRIAAKAIEIAPEMPAAYQTLGLANRLGFELDESAKAYAKALELDPASAVSKRSLAEMKRATGNFDESIRLYRELIEKDETDLAARTGLTLSLFDAGKRAEAEAEMEKTLAENTNNLVLLVGAAYWYAAHGDGAKAVELTREALVIEPRYTWAYIAMARGFLAQDRPLDAEKVLLTARNFGSFPTIDYEIAAARLRAGFYREAAEELKKNFKISDGVIETSLGGRIPVEAEDFITLLSLERQASIFEPKAADDPETAQKLKALLNFSQKLDAADEAEAAEAAERFVNGDDKMKIHRQLFAAGRLLDKRKALPKALELTQAAVKGVDSALDVPNAAAAVLADELYEARMMALSRGEVLLVPTVPKQTLSVILRGRIEEIAGWALYQQSKPSEAVTRLRRALTVLPEKSAWWRSALWRLGAALEADGKEKEALENYIKAYVSNEQVDAARYVVIESLYEKINGTKEGLEQKIGARPAVLSETVAALNDGSSAAAASKNLSEPEQPSGDVPADSSPAAEEPTSEAPQSEPETEKDEKTETSEIEVSQPIEEVSQPAEKVENAPVPEKTPVSETTLPPSEESVSIPEAGDAKPKVLPVFDTSPPVLMENSQTVSTPTNAPEKIADDITSKISEAETPAESESFDAAQPAETSEQEKTVSETALTETAAKETPTPQAENSAEEPKTEPQVISSETAVSEPEEKAAEDQPKEMPVADDLPKTVESQPLSEPIELAPAPTPELQPSATSNPKVRTKFSVVVTDNAPTAAEKNFGTAEQKTDAAPPKTTFEPVVIGLPKNEMPKQSPPTEADTAAESVDEAQTAVKAVQMTEKPPPIENSQPAAVVEISENDSARIPTRPRLVKGTPALDILQTGIRPCQISVSQEIISLVNSGGSIGIMVELESSSPAKVSAVSSSPQDVTVALEPQINAIAGRSLFIVKSVSSRKGAYTITFESECDKKEVQVRVR